MSLEDLTLQNFKETLELDLNTQSFGTLLPNVWNLSFIVEKRFGESLWIFFWGGGVYVFRHFNAKSLGFVTFLIYRASTACKNVISVNA